MSGAVPLPADHPWGRAARTRCPCVPDTGGVGMGDPAPAPQRALLRAGVARCGGGKRASLGGAPCAVSEGRLRSGTRPPPAARPQSGLLGSATHVLWARVCGRWGPALFFWLACPAGGRLLRGWWDAGPGGWPPNVVRGVWCQALCLSRAPVAGGGQPGPVVRVSWARVVWAWGRQHRPHNVRSGEPALRALGWRECVPAGGALRHCEGRLRSGARPPPAARPRGRLSVSTAQVLWARVCGRGGPALSLWLACPAGGCVPPGWSEAVPGGPASHCCAGCLASGAVPLPAARRWGRAARTRCPCVPGMGGVDNGNPTPAPARGLLRAGVARCGGSRRASASEVRRSASPGYPPWGRAVGVCCPRAVSAGDGAWGPGTVPFGLHALPGAACRGAEARRWTHGHRKGEAHQNAPTRPACLTWPHRARTGTHTRDPGVAFSDPKGEVSASRQKSPGAPAESPAEKWTVQEIGCVSDRVPTRQTTAAHAARDRSRRDPPGTTPSRGPERVQHRASPVFLPRQGPAAGTMSPVLGRPPRAQRSRPVNRWATAPGLGKGTRATGQPTGPPRATGPDRARSTNAGPRGTPGRHADGRSQGTRTGAQQQGPLGAAKPGSTHNTRRTTARELAQRKTGPPHLHTAPKRRVVGRRRAPYPGRPTARQQAFPPGRPRASQTVRKASSQERALWGW